MSATNRIYLDNAATSFPKPEAVYAAVDSWQRNSGAAAGRGAYSAAIESTSLVRRCRVRVAELLGCANPDSVIFTFNGTDSLNLALHGALRPGDHVVTSVVEHNSVLRPLRDLQISRGVESTQVAVDSRGKVDPAGIREAIRPSTRLVAITHASNVSGAIQPIADIAEVTHARGILLLVDAAQTAGSVPINLSSLPIDFLACPGHKGLLGPLGTGILCIREGIAEQLQSVRQGGTGTQSEDDRQPESLPDKFESGNHNVPGLVGLEAAVSWIRERWVEVIAAEEAELTARLWNGLSGLSGVRLFGPPPGPGRVGVVSLVIEGYDPQDAAAILDETFGVQVRSGLHCAPGAHRVLGTFEGGGTVRLSVGAFTTADGVDQAIHAVGTIAGSA